MSGFAFAAIYKEPTPPIGPGPDGPDIPPVDSDDPSYYTYTISGESITPFVPFTVTVTGSNSKAKGNHGNLQADIDYEIRDGGAWEGGKCEWTLGTRVCDSKRTNAKFSWLISGREPVTATLAYDAGTMDPEIEDSSVVLGKTFDFSITFSGAGDDCYATRLGDFRASYWWEAYKNGKWEKTTRIAESQTRFSKGVLSGTGHVGNLAGYEKIRLCVSYAGLATAYAEAAITSVAVTITLGDDSLHVWGPSTTLKIESESLQYMTAEFKRNGNATQDITDTNGDPIAFTFSGDTWTGDIQAATSAAEGTVKLVVKYGNEVVKEQEIGIATEFLPNISVSSQSIIQGDTFDMTGSIASTLGLLSRVPANSFKLVAVQDGTTLAEVNNLAGSQEVEYEGVTPSTLDTVYVRIIDNRDDTIVAEEEVTVQNVYKALAEAINERNLAKGITTTYTGEEGATLLRSYAIAACAGYVNADGVSASGTATNYTDTGSGVIPIDAAEESIEWYQAAYEKVCEVVSRRADATKQIREKSASGHYQYESIWDPEREEYIPNGTESGAKSNAEQNFDNNKTVGDWGIGSISESLQSSYTGQDYEAWGATISAVITDFRVKANGSSPFSRQADYYYQAKRLSGFSSDSTYNNLGHHNLSLNETKKLSSANAAAQSEFGWDEHVFTLKGAWVSYRGYRLEYKSCFVTYGFKHK